MMDSMRKVYLIQNAQRTIHSRMIHSLDSLELDSVPEHPSKFLINVEVFEEMAKSVTELHERDTELKEATQLVFENVQSLDKIKRMVRNLRQHLDLIQERLERDGRFIHSIVDKTAGIIETFRDRCKREFSEFLLYIDSEVRKVLKPLVPSQTIQENLNAPLISHSSLNSSAESVQEITGETEEERVNSHIHMLVNSLELVSKDLIRILGETNLKYFEFVCPDQGIHTPLGAPLPEYFEFTQDKHTEEEEKFKFSPSELKEKIQKIFGEGNKAVDKRILKMVKNEEQLNFDTLINDKTLSVSRKEDIVYQMINSGKIQIEKNDSRRKKVIHKIEGKPKIRKSTGFSTPTPKVQSTKARYNSNLRKKPISKQRSELKVRSITPCLTEKKRSFRRSKTPIRRKKMA